MYRIIFCLFMASSLQAQTIDTTKTFSLNMFLNWVRAYHPVMQQAALLDDKARAALLEAKGAFDPKLYADYEDKSFDQKNYFRVGEAGVKIPTWTGIDLKLAHSWSNGVFLNPAERLPVNGQAIAGVEVPLIRNLLFDQRRAQVEMAQLYGEANEAKRKVIINDLLLEAVNQYWKWAYSWRAMNVYSQALSLSVNRFALIRESFRQGDKPAIDTLEAIIQVQNRQIQLEQARVNYRKTGLELSNFLWLEDLEPYQVLPDLLKPEDLSSVWSAFDPSVVDNFPANPAANHPSIQELVAKQKQLEVKERLKKEAFKPQLNLSYNLLADGLNFTPAVGPESTFNNLVRENYKWGISFSYPILWRKERGGLQTVRLEQLENTAKIRHKQLEIQNKVNVVLQQLVVVSEQIQLQQQAFTNSRVLLDAENEKFRIGESSVFLLNNREQKLIETELKLIKLRADYQKLLRKLEWSRGVLL